MDSWELNKIAMVVLLIVTPLLTLNLLSDAIYDHGAAHGAAHGEATEATAAEKSPPKTAEKTQAKPAAQKKRSGRAPRLVAACLPCHTFVQGGKVKVGPNLWKIVGRQKASAADFKYSKALRNKGGVWDEAALDAFLTSPSTYIKGTRMAFGGIKNRQKRIEVIDWLKTLTDKK